jgi:leucyl/phenylalanyl-tRNA--protein transferase
MAQEMRWLGPPGCEIRFPDPRSALSWPNGLLAAGGDLSPERLLTAYRLGIFPWYEA